MTEPDWSQALCKGLPGDIFFPDNHRSTEGRIAKAVCNGGRVGIDGEITTPCPIKDDCFTFAKDRGYWGIWGGRYIGIKGIMSASGSNENWKRSRHEQARERISRLYTPEILAVDCPSCVAEVGEWCQFIKPSKTQRLVPPHGLRYHRAARVAKEKAREARNAGDRGTGQAQ